MREDVKKLMEFVDTVISRNAKCGYDTQVEIKYTFFGGDVNMTMLAINMEFYDNAIQFSSDLEDLSDFVLTLDITDEVKIGFDKNARTFVIANVGVTGILNNRIEGRLFKKGVEIENEASEVNEEDKEEQAC